MSGENELWAPGENVVNRVSMLLVPRQPWIDWAASLDRDDPPPAAGTPGNTYLLPAYDEEEDLKEFIHGNHGIFFEEELAAWTDDESVWPADRSWEMFTEWFDLHISALVYDLGDEPLAYYPMEDED